MGQNIFVPNAGGSSGSGSGSVFLSGLNNGVDRVEYGFPSFPGGGEIFYEVSGFTATVAFRMIQQNTQGDTIPLVRVEEDGNYDGWDISIDGANQITGTVGGATVVPASCEMPLGRVFVATITFEAGEPGTLSLFLNGIFMGEIDSTLPGPQLPVSILVGPNGGETKNYIEYIGWAFTNSDASAVVVADLFVATQDAGKIALPTSLAGSSAVYNAATGLTNLALWVPEINTLVAPSLPAVASGLLATGTLLAAPFRTAHSGFATPSLV